MQQQVIKSNKQVSMKASKSTLLSLSERKQKREVHSFIKIEICKQDYFSRLGIECLGPVRMQSKIYQTNDLGQAFKKDSQVQVPSKKLSPGHQISRPAEIQGKKSPARKSLGTEVKMPLLVMTLEKYIQKGRVRRGTPRWLQQEIWGRGVDL